MYSPTITVGISNENDTRIHYHLDTGNSVNVLSSLQMIKRTRNAETIKIFLQEKQKYNETSLEKIQDNLSDYFFVDEDGDVLGVSENGKKLSKLLQNYNILENLHKESFLYLMKYQFNLSGVKIDKNIIPTFYYKITKVIKEKERKENLDIFEKYLKMSPDEISEIEYKLFATSKEERLVKKFEEYKNEMVEYLPEKDIIKLLKEDITGYFLDCYKNIKQVDFKVKRVYSKREGSNLKMFGYHKERNRWYINNTLYEVLKDNDGIYDN
jgi:hypothetical protein